LLSEILIVATLLQRVRLAGLVVQVPQVPQVPQVEAPQLPLLAVVAGRESRPLDQEDHKVEAALRVRRDTTSTSLSTSKIC
jgi:hypothetical protein